MWLRKSNLDIKVSSKYNVYNIILAVFISFFILQIITGILLSMHYNSSNPFDSIEVLTNRVNYGWLLRNIHIVGVTVLFICAYALLFLGIWNGEYQNDELLQWWLFFFSFLLLCITVFLGYVLPWGQMSYWGATVITSIFGIFSEDLKRWILGDFYLSEISLIRFTALHYIFPFILAGFIFFYGMSLSLRKSINTNNKISIFKCIYVYLFFIILTGIIASYFIFFNIDFLLSGDNYFERDILKTPLIIGPEWYFLPYYSVLKAVPHKIIGALLMILSFTIYFILPIVDYTNHKSLFFKIIFICFLFSIAILSACGAWYDYSYGLWIMRLCVVYYFSFFLILLPIGSIYNNVNSNS